MPLHDHFRPPLSVQRHWHAFHNSWATYISSQINERLPPGYFAEANVQFNIEIDVAAFDETADHSPVGDLWTPPAPTCTVPYSLISDIVEINVFAATGGPTLAGAIELVSPANKDRPAHRDAFVSKCASYLQQGLGLFIVDVVTERGSNLHAALLERLQVTGETPFDAALYATAFRPNGHNGQPQLDIWQEVLSIGQLLPMLPLYLRGGVSIPVDLEASYERTCREQRVLRNGQ
jgi:hypothetical protein